jgi:hypothetical protein
MSHLTSVDEVIDRLRAIQATLPVDDGVAVFNGIYLTVTEQMAALIGDSGVVTRPGFADPRAMSELDLRFANLWLSAFDADDTGRLVPAAWRPLFEARGAKCLPIQFAIAGMNSHIEHDLPIAVVETCEALGREPEELHPDYEAVNDVLAEVESSVRRSFLDELGREVDDQIGPVVHLLSTWKIDRARDLSWITAQTLWELRDTPLLYDRFLDSVGHTVGMTSRALLTPRSW